MLNRRGLTAGIAASALAPRVALSQTVKATVGYPTSSDFLPAIVAKEFRHFESRGLDAVLTRVPLINNIPAAMMAGDIQIGAATPPTFLQAVDGGLDLVLIAAAARHQKDMPSKSLVVRTGVKYEKPEDLRGKKIGIAGFRSAMDILLKRWMKLKGVDPRDMTFIEAQFPQMPDLLRNGTLDAVTATEPIRSIIVKSGVGFIAAEYYSEVSPDFMVTNWMMRRELATSRPELCGFFIDGLEAAIQRIKAEPDAMREVEKKHFGVAAPEFPTFAVKASAADLQLWIDIGKEQGLYKSPLDAKKLVWTA